MDTTNEALSQAEARVKQCKQIFCDECRPENIFFTSRQRRSPLCETCQPLSVWFVPCGALPQLFCSATSNKTNAWQTTNNDIASESGTLPYRRTRTSERCNYLVLNPSGIYPRTRFGVYVAINTTQYMPPAAEHYVRYSWLISTSHKIHRQQSRRDDRRQSYNGEDKIHPPHKAVRARVAGVRHTQSVARGAHSTV